MGIDCKAKTLFDKVWEKHVITGEPGEAQPSSAHHHH